MSDFFWINGRDFGANRSSPKVAILTEPHWESTDAVNAFISRQDIWPLAVSSAEPCVDRASEHDHGAIFHTVTIIYQDVPPE